MTIPIVNKGCRLTLRSVLLVDKWRFLDLANDLVNAGVTVYILGDGTYKSSWMPRGVVLLPRISMEPKRIVGLIGDAVKAVSPDIVLPGDEETLYRIWDEAPGWISLVRPAIEPRLRALYQNKHLLSAFLKGRGVLIPETRVLAKGTLQEISPIVEAMGLPVVVKGARGSGGNQVRIVYSAAKVWQAVTELHGKTGRLPALQEYLAGGTYLVAGVFDHGRPLRMICAELVEMLPARTGPSILLTSRHEQQLLELATDVFQALRFTGFACADFVRGADGRFRFLEINPRPWGSYGFGKVLGVEMAEPWCRLQRGERVPSKLDYPAGRTWAKMPSYLSAPPLTKLSMLRRATHLVAIRSWHWHAPQVFYHQLREAYWEFRNR